ncbi:MAG: phosphate regulon sensor histidine kinase PhoR [Pseudomonadota bacterium]
MPGAWRSVLLIVSATIGAGLGVGAMVGFPVAGLALALATLLGYNLYRLLDLERTLRIRERVEVPEGNGVWSRVLAGVRYQQQRVRRHKRRAREVMREVRQSTNALPDGVIVLTQDNEIQRYNAAARMLLGLRRRRDRGQRVDHLVRHPDFVAYLSADDYALPVTIPSPVREGGWLSLRLVPYSEAGRLLTVRDISERTRLTRMRRDFVANASHELRTPLTVISGYLDAMRDDPELRGVWDKPLDEMGQQADRMRQMLDELLALSRLEASATAPADKIVDMGGVIRECAALFEDGDTAIEPEVVSGANVLGEYGEIVSVVSNLLSNAMRYGAGDAPVIVRWFNTETGAELVVEDRGEGIAPEDIPRLTERFYRVNRGRGRDSGGVGLGLAIVKHALARHDATLKIDSTLGEGSAFRCLFPTSRLAGPEALQAVGGER